MADERLTVLRSRWICSTNSVIERFLALAIAQRASQNSFSKEMLVLRPPIMTDRFMTAVFIVIITAEFHCFLIVQNKSIVFDQDQGAPHADRRLSKQSGGSGLMCWFIAHFVKEVRNA